MTGESRPYSARAIAPDGSSTPRERTVAVEQPVAVEYDGIGYAVMMMSPRDLEDFAVGFTLTERIADTPADILDIDAFEAERGWILRIALAPSVRDRIARRVRHRASETACGLCGIENLEQLDRPVRRRPPVPQCTVDALFTALASLRAHQPLNTLTGAVHAAAWCTNDGAVALVREDVGRHNALDKLIGARAKEGSPPDDGFLLVTSRISFEMVDKALVAQAPLLAGISAPTSLALDSATRAELTLIALARSDSLLIFSDPHRVFR